MAAKRRKTIARKSRAKRENNRFYAAFALFMMTAIALFINIYWFDGSIITLFGDTADKLGGTARNSAGDLSGNVTVHFIDVGQADCALIITPESTALIDSGEHDTASTVISYIKRHGITRLDYVIGTHPHSDHMGAMAEILTSFEIGEFIMPEVAEDSIPTTRFYNTLLDTVESESINAVFSETGRIISLCDGAELRIIGPLGSDYPDLNDYSVVTKLVCGEIGFLFTGDMENPTETELLENGTDVSADILKVGHHGSGSSSGKEFIAAVNPSFAVISVGKENSYGHPTLSVLDRLRNFGCKVLSTSDCGDIVFATDGITVGYATERGLEGAA